MAPNQVKTNTIVQGTGAPDEQSSELTRLLTEDGPQHFAASHSAFFGTIEIEMRNVTMDCAAYDEIRQEMAIIQDNAGVPLQSESASNERSSPDHRVVPVWMMILFIFVGAATPFCIRRSCRPV